MAGFMSAVEEFSLIWPEGTRPTPAPGDPVQRVDWAVDLDLERTIEQMSPEPENRGYVRGILLQLCQDPLVIRYRQAVLEDILRVPSLADGLQELLPKISSLTRYHAPREKGELLQEVIWHLGELETFVQCIQALSLLFERSGSEAQSDGFKRLAGIVERISAESIFQNLVRELPDLTRRVRSIVSVTIGVNLDENMQPREALLVSVNTRSFTSSSLSLLGRVFGKTLDREGWSGIAALHRVARDGAGAGSPGETIWSRNPMLVPLFKDLTDVLDRICRPVAAALKAYTSVNSGFLVLMSQELAFYLGGFRLVRSIERCGLPLCKPRLADPEERMSLFRDTFNVSLALRLADSRERGEEGVPVVTNDVSFGPGSGMYVLTGPNRGGKTTYMQTVGMTHVLAQAGLYVPGKDALLSPVDRIYTHFPSVEQPEMDAGRLGEEAKRLSAIFANATPRSLILLNESLSSTSPGESLSLAQDVVKALMLLRARAIYTTHLHELAAEVGRLNAEVPGGSTIVSMVALVEALPEGQATADRMRRTFKIAPRPPSGESYAREIASRYGISYAQLVDTLRRRGIV
jgi:DNA mismatch repair protein MutS